MQQSTINQLAGEIFRQNVNRGWWSNGKEMLRSYQLVVTELAEATEGDRKDLMDDKLPERKMKEVEVADACIRMMDLAGGYGMVYYEYREFALTYLRHAENFAAQMLVITHEVCNLALSLQMVTKDKTLLEMGPEHPATVHICGQYSLVMDMLFLVAEKEQFELMPAIMEKLEFNKTRADFDLKTREGKHGKKY